MDAGRRFESSRCERLNSALFDTWSGSVMRSSRLGAIFRGCCPEDDMFWWKFDLETIQMEVQVSECCCGVFEGRREGGSSKIGS